MIFTTDSASPSKLRNSTTASGEIRRRNGNAADLDKLGVDDDITTWSTLTLGGPELALRSMWLEGQHVSAPVLLRDGKGWAHLDPFVPLAGGQLVQADYEFESVAPSHRQVPSRVFRPPYGAGVGEGEARAGAKRKPRSSMSMVFEG